MLEGGKRINRIKSGDISSQPLISIITVCYNAEEHIRRCIESVIKYADDNIEYIIIDGNSNDNTVNVLREYDDQISYWLSEKDEGIYQAMNKAIKFTTGKWLLFLGADDELLGGVREMGPLLTDSNCIYYGDNMFKGNRRGGVFTSYRLSKSNICHQNIFYPKRVFEKYQYEEKYKISADHYVNIICWCDKEFRWEYHSFLIANFASSGISSQQIDLVFEADRKEIVKDFLGTKTYCKYLLRHNFRQIQKKVKQLLSFK